MKKLPLDNQYSLKNWGAHGQIIKAYNQPVPKRNIKPVLFGRKQLIKRLNPIFGNYIAKLYKQFLESCYNLCEVSTL